MLKGRGRDARTTVPAHLQNLRSPAPAHRLPFAKPEPDYEVVEFPSEQYVNAKLQPPPTPPRPPTGHPVDAGASCGLCGGGGARVRCAECGRRALCASCDDMYHRHPKRRHHQRQAISLSQLRDERPPLPPKVAPPVPPPRKHKLSSDRSSASPRPPTATPIEQRRATITSLPVQTTPQIITMPHNHAPQRVHQIPPHLQAKVSATSPTPSSHVSSMPYLPNSVQHTAPVQPQQTNTFGHFSSWGRPRGSLPGFNAPSNMGMQTEWEVPENVSPTGQTWGRPLRRGASVLELGGGAPCAGCAHCTPMPWRYGSCASLDHQWVGGWPPTQACCVPPHTMHGARLHPHPHQHPSQTPQPYRRVESRAVSRVASRAGSRATSPAMSVRSRTSRRKHRTPSPPPLPSSDADSESESENDRPVKTQIKEDHLVKQKVKASYTTKQQITENYPAQVQVEEDSLGPLPMPPSESWECEHCTYVNDAGIRVCAVCCRTPTAVPKTVLIANNPEPAILKADIARLKITEKNSPSPSRTLDEDHRNKNGDNTSRVIKERTSTASGPSPPRENSTKTSRLTTPTIENTYAEQTRIRHDMAVGPSPQREITKANTALSQSNIRESSMPKQTPERHSVSVGPSPPRENSAISSTSTFSSNKGTAPKKSTGTSPPRGESRLTRTNVSNTGTSPPPQSISTQTYEVPNSWEPSPSVSRSRSRPRRRFRDESRRERSHSRHSLSSDTRESDRSVRTSGGRWEWRETRDSSPGGEWSESERRAASRLTRRASHLDLRRGKPSRRSNFYGSEAASPEPLTTNRTLSLEALAGTGIKREAERGLELVRLMNEAERLGFSAAEVHAALAQNPIAPLSWLRERWPSLCEGVRAAAARLAPGANFTEMEARAALARHRGSMWPAVTDCVERHRHRQTEVVTVGEEGRLRGHVWGSPAGADDDAVPPPGSFRRSHRTRAEDSSDEYEAPATTKFEDDDWMYLPLDSKVKNSSQIEYNADKWNGVAKCQTTLTDNTDLNTEDVAQKLKSLLAQAGIPTIKENLLLRGLLADNATINVNNSEMNNKSKNKPIDLGQSENEFIDAYNALTRSSPLPNIKSENNSQTIQEYTSKGTEYKTSTENKQNEQISKNAGMIYIHLKQKGPFTDSNRHNDSHKNFEQPTIEANNVIEKKIIQNNVSLDNKIPANKLMTKDDESLIKNKVSNAKDSSSKDKQDDKDEDKTNNLSNMVDNTQKLIQQMKEEINSDINSMDGSHLSQSELENTSNESSTEHESSYSERSDTDNETGDLTSDENETSADEKSYSQKSPTKVEKTSSEESEQFEEAIDHLDSQIEDFKQTNIEILDSIAKSLQEEHTISLELNKTETNQQDVNNNLFMKVNTFEEIYDELNDVIIDQENIPLTQSNEVISQNLNGKKVRGHSFQHPNPTYVKKDLHVSVFEMKSPIKLIIDEYSLPILNASVEDVDESPIITEEFQDFNSDKTLNQNINYSEIVNVNMLENHSNIKVNDIQFDDHIKEKSESQSSSSEKETNNTNSVNSIPYIVSRSSSSPLRENNNEPVINLTNKMLKENVNNNTNITFDDPEEQNSVLTSNLNDTNYDLPSPVENKTIDKSEKISAERSSDNTTVNKNVIPAKSNIPKLIRVLQNNKQKSDSKITRVIASKVPIRRASIKQYPAPAPPKTHFGNIQSGHVKKLQTRLFDNTPTKSTATPAVTEEVKPSTSLTLNKKKVAPLPPSKQQEQKQLSSPKTSPPKEKKNNYFRETCRTEDEWTESDSEDSQSQRVKPNEEPERAPSPTPPITVRRVSGQMIDLARVRLPEGSPERQARMLLAEGATENWEQAQLAVELVKRGADPVAALMAALECADLDSALAYLHQDCELCASRLPEHEMVSMLACTHRCCRECAHHYFTVQITERSIVDCVCPYCKEPELEDLPEDAWLDYFAHLDILLKTLLDNDVHELFQRKLRDRTLARDPNFRWCVECSSGFFVHPKQKKLRCPECRSVSCATCRKPWSTNHEGLSCEQYAVWLEDNDPEKSVAAVQQHLRENGLECPRCKFRYSLSRGGCMHFTCTQCKYEFCYGCGKPFMMGARCGLSEYCSKLGLHAHHPRNCLFYLRDKEPHELQTLLQMNNVTYETEAAQGGTNRCPIQLQRETPTGLVDSVCGSEVPQKHAGLCKNHYLEYLSRLTRSRGVDPLPILGVDDLETLVRRAALRLPPRPYGSLEGLYKRSLIEIVKEKIPLD